jgi:hypothetical protein
MTITELQRQRDTVFAERVKAALRSSNDPYDREGLEAFKLAEKLSTDIGAIDRQMWDEINKLDDAALQTFRDEQAATLADLTGRLPMLRALADNDRAHIDARDWAYRQVQELQQLIPGLDRTITTRRQARYADNAQTFTKAAETARLYQQYVEDEGAQLATVAALTLAHNATNTIPNAMPPLPASSVARLRELKAFVAGVQRFGVKIDTGKLPEAVRRYCDA